MSHMKRKYTKYIMLKTVEKSPFYGTLWQGGLSGFSVPPENVQKLKNFLSLIFLSFMYVIILQYVVNTTC